MAEYNILKMQSKLKKYIDSARYEHTIGVMYTAAALAMKYEIDLEKAQIAGLLHDCAKCIPNDKKLKLCKKYNIQVSDIEKKSPYLLHSRLGAYIAREKYGIEDDEILHAIEFHTTGRAAMTQLEKIIFLADYIEPHRNKAANLEKIRKLAFEDLNMAVYIVMHDTLAYLEKTKASLDNQTVIAYNYYKEKIEEREV